MDNEIIQFIGMCFACLVIVVVTLIAVAIYDSVSCNIKWSGTEHRYQILGGCQVKVKGQWIPEANYRVI